MNVTLIVFARKVLLEVQGILLIKVAVVLSPNIFNLLFYILRQ